jgi:hypothetical protein
MTPCPQSPKGLPCLYAPHQSGQRVYLACLTCGGAKPVEQVEFSTTADDELEMHIASCWQMVTREYESGNREGADYWRLAAQEAHRLRSPEQVARMEAEQGLNAPCFFYEAGVRDMEAMRG